MGAREPVLVFDAECGFCRTWLGRLRRVLARWPEQIGYQQADLTGLGLTRERCEAELVLVLPDRTVGGAEAVAELLRLQPDRGCRWIGRALLLPGVRTVAGVTYRWVARNRHRLGRGPASCSR